MINENILNGFDWSNYYTLNQLKEEFGVSQSTIYHWRTKGLKTTKIGGKPIFQKSNVLEFFNRTK